ncbi:hypothetical protein H0H93_007497 [Arthromyces matolae]|nr:hypothetical protein H0H93_007497 [Arthromyces matolae]
MPSRIAGLERDAQLKGNQFNIALSVFYATRDSLKYGAQEDEGKWNETSAFVHAAFSLLIVVPGEILRGTILYLSAMYKRQELQLRYLNKAEYSLNNNDASELASFTLQILEGLATVIAGLVAALVLPADIESAKFLTDEERQFAGITISTICGKVVINELPATRLRVGDITNFTAQDLWPPASEEKSEGELQYIEPFELQEVIRGLSDIQAWLTGTAYLGVIVSIYSYSLFLPTIVAGLGYSGGAAQLHTVPPYVAAVVLTGYILAITANSNEIRYLAVFFMAAGMSILPNNTAGHYKKATTTALSLAIGNAGFAAFN